VVAAVVALALTIGGVAVAGDDGRGDDGETRPTNQGNDLPSDGPTGSETFVGLSVEDVVTRAENEGRLWRIARQDDEGFVLTDDLVPGRVTFEVDAGTITSAVIEQPNTDSPTDATVEDPARADLIAAAVKRLLTIDNQFDSADVFDDIRVASVIGTNPGRPLRGLDLEVIAATLSEVGTVRFVDDAEAESESAFTDSTQGVAVVSVTELLLLDDHAEVELQLWCGSMCVVYLTYEAVPDGDGWHIIGTKEPIAVS
jgi:hypothetical protein